MDNDVENTVIVRTGRNRELKIVVLFLSVICLGLFILVTVILIKQLYPSDQISTSITTQMSNDIASNLLDVITTMKTDTNSVQHVSMMTDVNHKETYINYSLPKPVEYETFGRPLSNSLYCNTRHFCHHNGCVISVNLRLFTDWKGDAPLYLFILPVATSNEFSIKHRYAIQPQKNTTEWQTIKIPSCALPIYWSHFLAVGMHDSSSKNQIYGIKTSMMLSAENMNENTTNFTAKSDHGVGVALSYTIVQNDKD